MIIAGDWVVPASSAPIREGAVVVRAPLIIDVGTLDAMRARYPELPVREHPGCVIAPGLVNAHTHLALTSVARVIGRAPFPEWLGRVAAVMRSLDADDLAASCTHGALMSIRAGVTTVGDVAYGPEAPAAAADVGLDGVFFFEVLGISEDELHQRLVELEFPADAESCRAGRTVCGLTAHAPYSSGPGLIRSVYRVARERGVPFTMHLAESDAEVELLASGTGPFSSLAARLAHGFTPPACRPIEYAHRLGALDGTIAVHCVKATTEEIGLLARKAAGVVVCPRSNRILGNGEPPVRELRARGVRLALGTDSLASNDDLDLFAEARALLALDHTIEPERLLAIMTIEGASVLGLADRVGALEQGRYADVIAVHVGATDDPVRALIERGSAASVRTVVSAGVLRVVDGRPTMLSRPIENASARVAEKAARALRAS
ncbi:MAG: amidohydrolase family protein [Anaerosomatales bacterium]|nr:amidohydrolase family protein [Anaerosomatales bacterium]